MEINNGINNVVIKKVNSIKYLGFIIDRDLKLKSIYNIWKNWGKYKFFSNDSMLTSINIYNKMLKLHFKYGSTLLYTCCTEQQLTRLQKLQNKTMHSILQLSRFTPITFMIDALRWLNVHKRVELKRAEFYSKN